MANYTLSPNMSLPVPTVGVDPGPDWATNLNASLSLIDTHDHSSGKGVPVTPSGMNISSDLSFLNNNGTNFRSVRFQAQSAPLALGTDLGCLYESGVDLYYNDGNGNQIRITQSGGIAGTSGSIGGLTSPASATYVSGSETFVWQSAANKPANLDAGFIILRNNTVASNGLTLSPPAAMGANFSITLPNLPASTKIMSLDSSGNIGASYGVDNSTIEISSNTIQVKAGGITRTQEAAVGQQISSNLSTLTITSTSYTDVTGLAATITVTGRPVILFCMPGSTTLASDIELRDTSSPSNVEALVKLVRGSTDLAIWNFQQVLNGISGGAATFGYPTSSIYFMDVPSAGTYTYKLQAKVVNGSGEEIVFNNIKFVAYEL